MTNPLLAPGHSFIDHTAFKPEHVAPAIDHLIAQTREAVERAADPDLPPEWDAVVEPMESASEPLWRAWALAGHLNAVVNTPELRQAYNHCLPKISELSAWMGLHRGLYQQYQRMHANPDFKHWPLARQRAVELALRDFRLGGIDLPDPERERYRQLVAELAQLSQTFSDNALDALDDWCLLVEDESTLAGIPADVVQAARKHAREQGRAGWLLNLQMPCWLPVMQYAQDRELRATLYRAYGTLASEQGKPQWDNSPVIERLLTLRAEQARLLGFADFAQLRLQTRMAENQSAVQGFLHELADRARPCARRDLMQLRAFAREQYQQTDLQPWDMPWLAERLREQRYAYSEDEVKQYFSAERVLQGLFELIHTLFQVQFQSCPGMSLWHPDARAWQVVDASGQVLGFLLMDLYARAGKQSGAWVDVERNRRKTNGSLQRPIVYLTCNFTPPSENKPALLTHDDVITLFHETGHALHALLSKVDEPAVGSFALEWDAVELPSQFMENFCWEWTVVQALSGHVDTGQPLPRELYDKLLAARHFQGGLQTLRQIEFSLFDMAIHANAQPATVSTPVPTSIQEVLQVLDVVRRAVYGDIGMVFPPHWHRFPHNFSHLFAGGYAAGYYSYKWAEVLSADAYAAFEEAAQAQGCADTLHPATGQRFLDEILAVGATRPAAESFAAFRGRAPTLDALLRHSGLQMPLADADTAAASAA